MSGSNRSVSGFPFVGQIDLFLGSQSLGQIDLFKIIRIR